MRCPGCNKFASLSFEEPTVESLEVSEDGIVTCTVSLSRTSECCGEEMKTAELELEEDLGAVLEEHCDKGEEREDGEDEHELDVEEDNVDQIEEGGGRYQKSYFGARVSFSVTCSCQPKDSSPLHSGSFEDKVAASEMEEAC